MTDSLRKAVIAKVLRARHPGATLADYVADAAAILTALDEATPYEVQAELHEMPATMLSVEQQIRLGVLGYLIDGGMPLEYDDPAEVARMLAPVADPLVAWVATGAVPSEPTGASE